jgi:hypothetical protein
VRRARAGGGDTDTQFTGELGMRRRHERCHFFMPGLNEFNLALGRASSISDQALRWTVLGSGHSGAERSSGQCSECE